MNEADFWDAVLKHGSLGCWDWMAGRFSEGYGATSWGGKTRYAHRVSYEMLRGVIPRGLVLDHLCRNRGCVNPAHLEPVTPWENTLRGMNFMVAESVKTHCHRGHEYTPENTGLRTSGSGKKFCRQCKKASNKEWGIRRRQRAASGASLSPSVNRPPYKTQEEEE